jgi:hypothetical protein
MSPIEFASTCSSRTRSRTGGTFTYFMDPDGLDVLLAQIL